MRILFLLHRFPYPPKAGGPWQALNLIRYLAPSHECHILAFGHPGDGPEVDEFHRLLPTARVLRLFSPRLIRARGMREALKRRLPRLAVDIGRAVEYLWRFRLAPLVGGWPYREFWRSDFVDAVTQATSSIRYDVVHVETIMLTGYRRYCGDVTTVASPYDALAGWTESRMAGVRGISRAAWRVCAGALRAYEREAYTRFSRVGVVSAVERERLLSVGAMPPVEAVPISVDDAFFSVEPPASTADRTGPRRLFVPASWKLVDDRTVETLMRFLREGLQALRGCHDVRAVVSYAEASPAIVRRLRQISGVEPVGWVPDFRQALCDADVVVFTDHSDSGVKNRAVQAMAAARPIVATPAAASGLGADDGRHLWIRETPRAMADAIDATLRDPQAARRMSDAARAFARERFSMKAVGAKWESLYARAIASSSTSASPRRSDRLGRLTTRPDLTSRSGVLSCLDEGE